MEENPIFFADGNDPEMIKAYRKAQETFKYFWREQSWEYRRIIPGLNVSCVKTAFEEQDEETGESLVEHMWINEIFFDGDHVRGYLINEPNSLKNIQVGDYVEIPLSNISDWLFAITPSVQKPKGLSKLFSSSSSPLPKAYGGFTIQKMRADMSDAERKEHDNAWQLDFGDFNDILVVNNQKENPENLIEHPMSKNMKEEFAKFLQQYPDELTQTDEDGLTLLHKETIAGNLTTVKVALEAGADKNIQSKKGKTALDYAKQLNWEHLIPVLEG
ncbi:MULTISPECIES: DUF2314 domain-containing protein [Chryseobacterium]|uniref:DUF2314 domain-containing protein n=1 Tax=Chryseobacterium TaxID=59732 RepID=UPI000E757089|nr:MULTISPECIES: DUF2314 domain-containing protein [Chryseobacterium]MDH5034220.1 DUF2314 domain-containing protein [Chryseobacterium cucumeris]QWT87629.1 DUF2314 domain-containing protein [Chryseobacterium sp. PCH239]RKE80547.1 uncharacterized protein YegJ (DUF2314 family) [Chryseobacterium sp. AG363]TXJ00613.1 MAG: DUF2314 domain-containing protein [Chryseobacterium cucumeris]